MKTRRLLYGIYIISIFILLCKDSFAYFTWNWDYYPGYKQLLLYGSFSLIAFVYKRTNKIRIKITGSLLGAIAFFLLGTLIPTYSIGGLMLYVVRSYPLLILLSDEDNTVKNLRIITELMGLLLIPGIIVWVANLKLQLPAPIIQHPNESDNYLFFNYIVNIGLINDSRFGFIRFQSVFLEPGYLGVLLSFLLYANKYRIKRWYNMVCLIGLLFSFSLAGYIITGVGVILSSSTSNKTVVGSFIVSSFLVIVFVLMGRSINNGDNIINNVILSRISGANVVEDNNRFGGNIDYVFNQSFSNGKILFGDPSQLEISGDGAGYKVFLIIHGIIGTLFSFLLYLCLLVYNKQTKYGYGFLFIICITFLQASYPYSCSWLIPYILGLTNNGVRPTADKRLKYADSI